MNSNNFVMILVFMSCLLTLTGCWNNSVSKKNAPESNELTDAQLKEIADAEGMSSITMVIGKKCYSLPQQKGVVRLSTGNPGDKVKITLKCGKQVMGGCVAKIAAGATIARCETAKIPVDNTHGLFSCSSKVIRGNARTLTIAAACQDP